jgi:hypothetical protein
VPEAEGSAAPNLMLYLMCDSYMGADQVCARPRRVGTVIRDLGVPCFIGAAAEPEHPLC